MSFFKEILSLSFTLGLPVLFAFITCPVPDYLPGNLCRCNECRLLRFSEWMWGAFSVLL